MQRSILWQVAGLALLAASATSVAAQLTRPPTTSPTVYSGAPPTGFRVVTSTPASVALGWNVASGATGYTLLRATGVGQPWITLTPAPIAALTFVDQNAVDYRVSYIYRLQAHYASTPPGSADITITLPTPADPSNFAALAGANGSIALTWTAAPFASGVMLYGPGLPAAGVRVNGSAHSVPAAPPGPNTYRVASVFDPGGVLTASGAWPSAVAVVVPIPSVPWLTMNNGRGDAVLTNGYYTANCSFASNCAGGQPTLFAQLMCSFDLFYCSGGPPYEPTNVAPPQARARFVDPLDLGVGRDVVCAQMGSRRTARTLCYAASYGPDPMSIAFGDVAGALSNLQTTTSRRGVTAIVQDRAGLSFFAFKFTPPDGGYSEDVLSPTITLDATGPRNVPHACLACHGGRFNPTTMRVEGATLLPIDPRGLVFHSSNPSRASEEENIRQLNAMMLNTGTMSAAAVAYLTGLYNGAVTQVGARANDNFVPPGWTAQAGLYRDIVRPYCASCHLAQSGSLAFASWTDFLASKERIQNAVCVARSMPHGQLLYKQFWTLKGNVFLPGVLSASLGYPKCP